jgi:hypothetical protein
VAIIFMSFFLLEQENWSRFVDVVRKRALGYV